MKNIITVDSVGRVFKSPKKDAGLKGALKLLFNPEYKEHQALKNVSFEIEPGTFNGLIGANGAGKTTLLKILSGLLPASSGTACVLGLDPFKRTMEFRKKISLVMGQKAQLWWDLPAIDAFELIQAIYEIPKREYNERLNTLTELLDVQKLLQTQIRRLSLGERMKMELIGALLHWPEVIFLDEPTIGLDVLAAHKLREFLKLFNTRERATIILTSHNMDDIEKLCSRVLILKSGELIFDGKPNGLVKSGEIRLRVRLMQKPRLDDLVAQTKVPLDSIIMSDQVKSKPTGPNPSSVDAPVIDTDSGDDEDDDTPNSENEPIHFCIKQDQVVSVLQVLMSHYQVIDMGIEEPSLESVIQNIYQDPLNTITNAVASSASNLTDKPRQNT